MTLELPFSWRRQGRYSALDHIRGGRQQCSTCQEWLVLDEENFSASVQTLTGFMRRCRGCTVGKKYGITGREWRALAARSAGVCAICRNPPGSKGLVLDHDHTTGEIRGLLCQTCNSGLGMLRDDPDVLRAAADYLNERRQSAKPVGSIRRTQ